MPRKAPKKKVVKKPAKTDKALKKLNLNQDLFCHFYVQNTELRGNATQSYSEAFGYRLNEQSKLDAIWDHDEKGNRTDMVSDSSYARVGNICAVEAFKLLRNPKIQDRITTLYNSLLEDHVVDGELARLIMQNEDKSVKTAAIREYNKVRGRIIDKRALTDSEGNYVPITTINVVPLDATGPLG